MSPFNLLFLLLSLFTLTTLSIPINSLASTSLNLANLFPRDPQTVCPILFNDCTCTPCPNGDGGPQLEMSFHTTGGSCWDPDQSYISFTLLQDCTGPETMILIYPHNGCTGDATWYYFDAGCALARGGVRSVMFWPPDPVPN